MPLNRLAPTFSPHKQFPTDPPISLCNSTTMSLSFARKFCRMPLSIAPPQAPPITQPITDSTFVLPFIQHKNPSPQDAETLQPLPVSPFLWLSFLQHQEQCLQAIHKIIQQFHQHLKAEQLPLILTPTLLQMHCPFFKLMNRQFVVLPRRALWDHQNERKTNLHIPTFSPLLTHRRPLQLRHRISHQKFFNPTNYSLTK